MAYDVLCDECGDVAEIPDDLSVRDYGWHRIDWDVYLCDRCWKRRQGYEEEIEEE